MSEISELLVAIDKSFFSMETQVDLAKKSMGVRPDLVEALEHVHGANQTVDELKRLEAKALECGFGLSFDMVHKINTWQEELLELSTEIIACMRVVEAGNARDSLMKKRSGKDAPN